MWSLIWAVPATIAVAVVWGVSAIANYDFGLTQGTADPINLGLFITTSSQANGMASLAVDLLKTLTPTMVVVAVIFRKWLYAAGAALCFLICFGFSMQNAIGYVMTNHSRAVDGRGQTADQWEALRSSLTTAQQQRAMVPVHRPLVVLESQMEALRADRRFAESGRCASDVKGMVNFCREYRALDGERAAAQSAEDLDAQLAGLRKQLDSRKKISDADPFASAAALLGFSKGQIAGSRSLWVASMFEILSAIGLALIWGLAAESIARDRQAKAARMAQRAAEPVEAAAAVAGPVLPPEPALPTPDAVRAAIAPPKGPAGPAPGVRKTSVRKPDEAEAVGTQEASERPALKLVERSELIMPSYASTFFEESAPPAKVRRVAQAREKKKSQAQRSAKVWLSERTERGHSKDLLAIDDAWEDYLEFCRAEDCKHLPKHSFATALAGAKIQSKLYAGRRHLVGVMLVPDHVPEKQRAFG